MASKKAYSVEINRSYCKSCGLCYWICPTKTIIKGKYDKPEIPDQTKCIGCLQCERICPDFAINVVEIVEEKSEENK
jgi:2-oxoglutarate ferredoxin oxidoreductase subunit delta